MKSELGILFLHHDITPVVKNNLESIRRHNPEAQVVTMSAEAPLPGGYSLVATPELHQLHSQAPKNSSDRLICSWFSQRREVFEKWWIVEWDTYCRRSVFEYYQPVWHFPFVATTIIYPNREPGWPWFKLAEKLPRGYVPYALGASPFIYLVSEPALSTICRAMLEVPILSGNGELRFATVANKCGIPPCGFSPPNDKITWMRWDKVGDEPTIFHPVKHLV